MFLAMLLPVACVQVKDGNGRPFVRAKAFKVQKFPQFLEGYVRHFKVLKDEASKIDLYQKVRRSLDNRHIPLSLKTR